MKVCWRGLDLGDDLLGGDGLGRLVEREEGLDHLAGQALVGLVRVQREVLVPGVAGGAELALARGRVVARRRRRSCRRPRRSAGGRGRGRPRRRRRTGWCGCCAAAALILASRRFSAAVSPPPLLPLPVMASTMPPRQAAGADGEADEAHEHEQREAEVDNLDGAAPPGATQIEQHGWFLVLVEGDELPFARRGVFGFRRPRPPPPRRRGARAGPGARRTRIDSSYKHVHRDHEQASWSPGPAPGRTMAMMAITRIA